ncbi:MAG: GntR family transcriptional regulator [Endomicrobia bacterium]|nr:GntR family transcriptional regulator [Endomicrobiia bacterium]
MKNDNADEYLPKYKKIVRYLIEKINSKEYKRNSLLPSEKQLCEMFNCSRVSVRQAIGILVKNKIVQPLPGIGTVILKDEITPYILNSIVEEYPVQSAKYIYGVIAGGKVRLGIDNPFYSEIIEGIEEKVRETKYHFSFTVFENIKRATDISELILNKNISGFILLGEIDEKFIITIKDSGLPIILVNNHLGPKHSLPSIVNDDFRGGYEATKYLFEIGCKKIACFKGPVDATSCEERVNGYKSALKDLGLPVIEENIIEGNLEFESGYEKAKCFLELKSKIDSIFVVNDLMALGVIKYFIENGIKIPEDVNIIGFDNIPQSSQLTPALTTMNIERRQMGYIAASKIIEFIENLSTYLPIKITLPSKLVVRDTTRKV